MMLTCKGFSWKDHSEANLLLYEGILALLFFIYFNIRLQQFLFKKYRTMFVVWNLFLFTIISTFYYKRIYTSCDRFYDSLLPSDIYREDVEACQWKRSSVCWSYTFEGTLDPILWFQPECKDEKTDLSTYSRFKDPNKVIKFANPGDPAFYNRWNMTHILLFQKATLDSAREVDPSEINDPNVKEEAFLDLREKGNEKMHIKLKSIKNTPAGKKLLPHDKDHVNILQIFIDTVSRNRFYRLYKKTIPFLQKYHHSKKKNKRLYEFFRHHSNRGYTNPNLMGVTYGDYDYTDINKDKRIDSYAREQGYVTGVTFDFCNTVESERTGIPLYY